MGLAFKVDENLPLEIAERLREAGHDAVTVIEQQLGGAQDADLATVCRNEDRILVTLDLDFADIITYPPQQHPGLLVLRSRRQDTLSLLAMVERLIGTVDLHALRSQLWIVEENRVRIRS